MRSDSAAPTQDEDTPSYSGEVDVLGLPMRVVSEDGVEYTVRAFAATEAAIELLWDSFRNHTVLFSDENKDNLQAFTNFVLAADTVILEVIGCGVVYLTELVPESEANGHYLFWDKKTRGRQRLLLSVLAWFSRELKLHRINAEIPIYAYAALHRMQKLGICAEGRRRQSVLKDGVWWDSVLFGIIDTEFTNEAVEAGRLVRTVEERSWHGLIESQSKGARSALMTKILGSDNGGSTDAAGAAEDAAGGGSAYDNIGGSAFRPENEAGELQS